MKRLRPLPVCEAWHVELMRQIYNENIETLATKPIPLRSYEDQQTWWSNNKHVLSAYLYEPIERTGKFIGFLLLNNRGGFCTPIVALQKEEQGRGYGEELIADAIEKAGGPIACSQLQSNIAICRIHQKLGYQILGQKHQSEGTIDLLFHPGPDPKRLIDSNTFDSILDYLKIDKVSFYINHRSLKIS